VIDRISIIDGEFKGFEILVLVGGFDVFDDCSVDRFAYVEFFGGLNIG